MNKAPQNNTRVAWIDATKGLGISLIVLGHVWSVTEPSLFYIWFFAFHVPLFFFVSGLTLNPRKTTFPAFALKKSKTLLIPYLVFAIIGYIIYAFGILIHTQYGGSVEKFEYGLITPFLGIFYGSGIPGYLVNTPLWFLTALFFTLLGGYIINRLFESALLKLILTVTLAYLSLEIAEIIILPLSILPALLALVFVQAGYEYAKMARHTGNIDRAWLWLTLLFFLSLFAPINGIVAFITPDIQNYGLFLIFAFIGIAMSVLAAQLFLYRIRFFLVLGKHSLAILVTHMLVINAVKVVFSVFFGISIEQIENTFLAGAIVLLISILILAPLIAFLERFFPWTLGRSTTS